MSEPHTICDSLKSVMGYMDSIQLSEPSRLLTSMSLTHGVWITRNSKPYLFDISFNRATTVAEWSADV